MKKQPVYVWQKLNSPVHGARVNNYCYVTEYEGHPWLADIEEDQMFEPDTFKVDPDPCGTGFKDMKQLKAHLAEEDWQRTKAIPVGYVLNGKLFITKRIKVETGWGGFNSYNMFPTSVEYIRPNVSRL